jgi:hypothetical protein
MRVPQLQKCCCLLKTLISIILYSSTARCQSPTSPPQHHSSQHPSLPHPPPQNPPPQNSPQVEATKKEGIRDVCQTLESFSTVNEVDLGKSQDTSTTNKHAKGDGHIIDIPTIVGNFFGNFQKYQHKEPLENFTTPGMSMESFLFQNKSMKNCQGPW